jgi:hypothetical protein
MDMMGVEIAKMHKINIIHGDLTTSNMMVRRLEIEDEENEDPPSTSGGEKVVAGQCPPAEVVRCPFPSCPDGGTPLTE